VWNSGDVGGGGGAGGVVYQRKVSISAGTYTAIVGAGGAERLQKVTGVSNRVDGALTDRVQWRHFAEEWHHLPGCWWGGGRKLQ
jgi:hypothetical protein